MLGDKTRVDYSTINETMEEQNLRRGGPVKKKVSTPVKKKAGGAVKKAAGVAKSKYGMNKGGFTSRGGNYY